MLDADVTVVVAGGISCTRIVFRDESKCASGGRCNLSRCQECTYGGAGTRAVV